MSKEPKESMDLEYQLESPEQAPETDGSSKQIIDGWRSLSAKTQQFYGAYFDVAPDGEPKRFTCTHANGSKRIRNVQDKSFFSSGPINEGGLFGKERFNAGSAKAITVTEGYEDAMAVYQMLGSKYPVVSVRSASTAKKDCKLDYEFLNSFEKIYLCFDNDEPGRKAKQDVASLFDFNKIYDVPLTKYKDANDYLVNKESASFQNIWYNSKRFLPKGILSSFSEFDKALDEEEDQVPVATFPFPTWQSMFYGIRPEIYLVTAQEGQGKTEVFRAIENHLLESTNNKIGIIHLEEPKTRTIKGIAGYKLKLPVHLPTVEVSKEDIKKAYREAIKYDDRVHIYSRFGSDDPDVILDTIRFLVSVCDCRFIFLDHITMIVTGLEGEDERKKLDYISTKLDMMVEELRFTLFLISHINDDGKTRGSRNISKVAHNHVRIERNIISSDPVERNTTICTIFKNRFGAETGPAGKLFFDKETFLLSEVSQEEIDAKATGGVPF